MAAAILGFLTALPELLQLLKSFMAWMNHVSGNDPQGFAKELGAVFTQLSEAKTDEEKTAAAKSIADFIHSKL